MKWTSKRERTNKTNELIVKKITGIKKRGGDFWEKLKSN